jgi:hypothetical protein
MKLLYRNQAVEQKQGRCKETSRFDDCAHGMYFMQGCFMTEDSSLQVYTR